jgi:hypothetical protein
VDTTCILVGAVRPPPAPATDTPAQLYVETFQPFLNNIPQRDPAEVRAVMEEELGRPREEVFSTFEEKPIGCASIGQVGFQCSVSCSNRSRPRRPRPPPAALPHRSIIHHSTLAKQPRPAAVHGTT